MIKRNIAIAILICVIIAIFAVAIIVIVPHDKNKNKEKNESVQPVMKISDFIDEAVYMGSYSTDTEIFADEQFAAKEILRTALAKSSGLPENVPVMIESYNYDNLSVFFDDGRTMRTLEQSGMTNVMIVASIPKPSGDVYYAYNVQISVNESRTPKNTSVPDVTGSDLNLITKKTGITTVAAWKDNKPEYVTAAVTKKSTWTKTTTAAVATVKPAVTEIEEEPVVTEAPVLPPVTEAPVQPDPVVPSPDDQPEPPSDPEPQPEPPSDPEPQPEPPADPVPEAQSPES